MVAKMFTSLLKPKTEPFSCSARSLCQQYTTYKNKKGLSGNKKHYIDGLVKVLSDSSKFQKYCPPSKGPSRPSQMNVFEKKTKEVNEFVNSIENLSDYVQNCYKTAISLWIG